MNKADDRGPSIGELYVHFIEWLDSKLVRAMGPAPLGPYEQVVKRVGEAVCPVCGRPMTEHTIDHSTPNAILNCPTGPKSEPADGPVNEFGMPKPQA
jgi:hypothetical protein